MMQIIKQNKDENRKQNYMYFFVVKASSLGKKSNRFIKRNMLIVNLLILQLIQKSIEKNTVSLVIVICIFLWQRLFTQVY